MYDPFDLVPVEIEPAAAVLGRERRGAPGREQPAGALGVGGLQRIEAGLQGLEQRGPAPLLPDLG